MTAAWTRIRLALQPGVCPKLERKGRGGAIKACSAAVKWPACWLCTLGSEDLLAFSGVPCQQY